MLLTWLITLLPKQYTALFDVWESYIPKFSDIDLTVELLYK